MTPSQYYNGITTPRFWLRKLSEADIEDWCSFFVDNPYLQYLGIELNKSDYAKSEEWIEVQTRRYAQNAYGQLAIISKNTGELVGTVGFNVKDWCKTGELVKTTAIKPPYWRQGIGREASIALINAAFEQEWAHKIYGIRGSRNERSRQFTHSMGFRDVDSWDEEHRTVVLYQLTKKTWKQLQAIYYPQFIQAT